jgi:hypothetical protein
MVNNTPARVCRGQTPVGLFQMQYMSVRLPLAATCKCTNTSNAIRVEILVFVLAAKSPVQRLPRENRITFARTPRTVGRN